MSTILTECLTMAKESENDAGTRTVRLHNDIVRMVKTICANTIRHGRPLKATEFLDELLRPQVVSQYEEVLDRLTGSDRQAKSTRKRKPD